MANLKLNNVVVVTESAGAATVQSGIFKAKDGTAAFTVADSTGAATFTGATTLTGNVTAGANLTVAGDLTVSGTTTTVDTALTVSDATIINNAGSDVGLKINSTSTGHIMQLQDNGTDVLVVKDGGNVGVGTATPTELFEVEQSTAGTITKLKIDNQDNTNTGSHSALFISTGGASGGDPLANFNNRVANWNIGMDNSDSDKLKISTTQNNLADNTKLTMLQDGKLGIGTDAPATSVEIAGTHVANRGLLFLNSTDHSYINLDSSSSSNDSGVFFSEAGTPQMLLGFDGSENHIRIEDSVAGENRVVITQAGEVGINAVPGAMFHVNGSTQNEATVRIQHQVSQAVDTGPDLEFYNVVTGTNAYQSGAIRLRKENGTDNNHDHYLSFDVRRNSPEGVVERMRINSSGHVHPGSDNTQNLGSLSLRWANLYVGDMHFSNEGKEGGNEVDGTTGEWTIQEGDENLFVLNRKTGKKFKMNLTEV